MAEKVLLLVPIYNESQRLKRDKFLNRPKNISLLLLDDGSTDSTEFICRELASEDPQIKFQRSSVNLGKGNLLQFGFSHYREFFPSENFDWIGYWDADLSTPFNEVLGMIRYENDHPSDALWASRKPSPGARIQRRLHRHISGRIFAFISCQILGHRIYDTQCGAKLFKPRAADISFVRPFISRWVFDQEILLRLEKSEMKILEYPVSEWTHVPGSKINVIRDSFRVIWDLLKIRKFYLRSLEKKQ